MAQKEHVALWLWSKKCTICFPCLVFEGDAVWTKDGFTNISNMKERTEKQEKFWKHIENVVSMSA